jgi:hypothetical protein
MIQRVQTLYLLFGALALAGLGFFDTPWNTNAAAAYGWYVPSLIGLIGVTAAGALGSIFLYEDRQRQRQFVVGTQVVTVVLAAVMYGGLYLVGGLTLEGTRGAISWGRTAALAMPPVAYALFYLARRGIDHDIELVKSMDRLR